MMALRVTQFGVALFLVLHVASGNTSTQTLTFIPTTNRFHGLETWLTVKNRAVCGAICLAIPTCGAFAWYNGQPHECLVLRDVWGRDSTTSGGVFYRTSSLTQGTRLLVFPTTPASLWGDILQACLDNSLDLLQTPSTDRDVNIIASLGRVALDAKKSNFMLPVLTHDGKKADTSKFKKEPENNFGLKAHCLMSDHFALYWIVCDEYASQVQEMVCEQP